MKPLILAPLFWMGITLGLDGYWLNLRILNNTNGDLVFLDNLNFYYFTEEPLPSYGLDCYFFRRGNQKLYFRSLKETTKRIYLIPLDSASELRKTALKKNIWFYSYSNEKILLRSMRKKSDLVTLAKGDTFVKKIKLQANVFSKSSYCQISHSLPCVEFFEDTICMVGKLNFYYSHNLNAKKSDLQKELLLSDTLKLPMK